MRFFFQEQEISCYFSAEYDFPLLLLIWKYNSSLKVFNS